MINLFQFNGYQVRVFVLENQPWIVATDVAKILDYADPSKMLNLVDGEDKRIENPHKLDNAKMAESFSSNTFKVSLINESGVYACIFGSTKPEAKIFKKWVTSELLPTIRKTGSYSITKPKTAIELAKETVLLAQNNLELLEQLQESEKQKQLFQVANKQLVHEVEIKNELIETQKPKVKFYSDFSESETNLTINQLAKVLSKKGGNFEGLGQNKLFQTLREKGFLYKSENTNIPYQRYINDGTFVVIKKVNNQNPSFNKIYSQTLVTPKGCQKIYHALQRLDFTEEPEIGCIQEMCENARRWAAQR